MLEFCRMSHRLRPLAVLTRLRASDRDALVLWALGLYLGGLANQDLALRCAQGTAGGDGRRESASGL